jgi:hypothetical protein
VFEDTPTQARGMTVRPAASAPGGARHPSLRPEQGGVQQARPARATSVRTGVKTVAASIAHHPRDRLRFGLVFLAVLLVIAIPASAGNTLDVTTVSPRNGQTVSGSITWQVVVGSANVQRVDFAIDGTVKWSEHLAPWLYDGATRGLNTTTLSNGAHRLTAKAYSKNGKSTGISTVTVTVSNGAASAPAPSPTGVTQGAPMSSSLPTISGTTTVGQTLSASTGTWSGSTPMSYAYSWSRCNSTGGSCSPISGATSAGYLLGSADAGSTIRVGVTATNGAGSATATSAATGLVATAAPSAPAAGLGTALPPRLPESSGTQTLVVTPSGSATSSCTLSTPCSFNRAWSLATSGTVIQLRGNAGNYSGNLFISGKSYSSSNPVTMTTYPGDPIATFVGSSTSPEWALHVQGDQGIRLRNFKVSAPTNGGVHIEESWHIDVDRLVSIGNGSGCSSTVVFTSCGAQGILVSGGNPGFFTTYSDDVQIWNSVLANNGGNSTYASVGCCASSTNHDHSLYLGGGPETVEPGFRNAVVADNLIFDSKDGYPVQVGQSARNLIFTNNTIDNTSNSDAACAIVVYGTGTWASSGNLFVNNIISNVAGSGSSAVCASLGKNLTGNHVRNNLAYGVSGTTYDPVYGSYTGFDCVTSCPGQNLPNANPLFVDTVGTYADPTSKDFHLQAGSPALGKADPAYTPPFDRNGNARPAAPAVGAFG